MGLFDKFRRSDTRNEARPTAAAPAAAVAAAAAAAGADRAAQQVAGLAVVDVETTGLQPSQCRILELAILLCDDAGQPTWEWVGRFNPQGPVGASHVHGITAADVADAPLFADTAEFLAQVLAGRVLVGHNVTFDVGFLRAEFLRAGWDVPQLPSICTLAASRVYLPQLGRWRLADCCAECGVSHTAQHSSLGDARATAALLNTYLTRTGDAGAWLECDAAVAAAARTVWPTAPTRAPAPPPAPAVGEVSARRWVSKPAQPALVTVVRTLELADVLDEGANEGSLPYLELVATALEDGVLTDDERAALAELAGQLELTPEQIDAAHRAFLLTLCHAALLDGKVSRAENAELVEVAALFGLPKTLVAEQVKAAEATRNARMSAGLKPLPDDWDLGEPLRVGDKVVFTGCEAFGRDRLEQQAQKLGVRVTGSVSRRTAMLITDGTVDGTKAAAAAQCGTRQVHPTQFETLLTYLQPAIAPAARATRKAHTVTAAASTPTVGNSEPALATVAVAPAVVRAWAIENGYEIGQRGRIHRDIIEAYLLDRPGS